MPLDPQLVKDLNAAIALGRKKELPFGICLGKKPEATVWKVMKTKSPEVNGKLAKKEGETGQFTFGVMTVKSKDIHLVLHGKMLPGVVKKLKAFLKAANIKMKVKVFDLEGTVLEADEEDEAGGGGAGTPKPDPQSEPDPLEAKWKSIAAQVLAAIKKVKGTPGIDLQETTALWGVAVKQAEAGAFTKALTSVQQVATLLKDAATAAKQGDKVIAAQAKKWQEAAAKLTPLVSQMMEGGYGDTPKINALWTLAKSKASAATPDYKTALKAVGALAQLLSEAKKAAAAAPATASATPAPAMAGGAAEAPEKHSGRGAGGPDDGTSIGGAKLADIERLIPLIEAQITRYDALMPASGEPIPPKWPAAVQGAKALITPMQADPAKMDAAKLDTAQKALTMLQTTITEASTQKTAWKSALELFNISLAPLEHHPKAADPAVKPTIDAIKADRDAAIVKATAHDHKQAIIDLAALPPRCVNAEALADDFSEWKVLDGPRKALAQTYLGQVSGNADVDAQTRLMEGTYTHALADATAKKYKDAVAKLDLIPDMFKNLEADFHNKAEYDSTIAAYDPLIAAINALDVAVRTPVQAAIDTFNTRYTAAKFAVTADYKKSNQLLGNIADVHIYIDAETTAIGNWITALKVFDTQLTTFKAHAGKSGIQDIILEMERDRATGLTEATANKHTTALAVLNRSQPKWAVTTTMAQDCASYLAARKAAQDKIDALSGTPEAASLLAQATTMLGVAGTQAINKNFAAAKTSADEAAKRADAAKAAADTKKAVAALKDTGALDKLAQDWDAAYKVYTDTRSAVAAQDSSHSFDASFTAPDAMAEQGKAAHGKGEFDDARAFLGVAVGQVQAILELVLAFAPYQAHKTKVSGEITALTPLNIDDSLKPKIDAATALVAEAEALAKAPVYNFSPAEQKLAEASKIATRATADAALYTQIKANRTIIAAAQTAINAVNAAKIAMPKRLMMLQKMLGDIDALVTAGKFGEAEQKAQTGAAMQPAILADIITVQACQTQKASWHDAWLGSITGPGTDAGKEAYKKVVAKLKIYTDYMTSELFDVALTSLGDVSAAVVACDNAIKGAATYAPVKATADAKLNPLKTAPSPAIAAELQKIVDSYDKAVALAKDDKYFTAQKIMAAIPDACDKLTPLHTAFLAFEPTEKAALDKLVALNGHAQAASIAAMIERLQGKYDNAMKYADSDKYDDARKLMAEIPAAADEALAAADRHALLVATNEMIAGDDESAPWWPQIAAAKAAVMLVAARGHSEVAQTNIDDAFAQLAEAKKDGQDDSTAKAALKAGLEACNKADEIISQYQFHLTEIGAARALVTALGGHIQQDYIATDLSEMDKAIDAAATSASTGTDVSAQIEAVRTHYHAALALADGYDRYLTLRAEPEVEDRLTQLEEHQHRYAIKPSIDTLRAKLQKATDEIGARTPEAAIKLLEEARALGTSAFVTAEMMANTPPTEDDLKKILARPGGADELDAIIDSLPEEAQRKVLKVAFKARYGCDIENFTDQNVNVLVPDGSQKGPNIKAFYKAMEDLPLADTLDNDSLREFSIVNVKTPDASFYDGDEKQVVMDEGNEATSSTRYLGSSIDVDLQDDDSKLANDEPVNYFNWNTLHEVGHAVDDRDSYMDKNGKNDNHGGWVVYGANVKPVAEKIQTKYKYDLGYIITYMAGNNNPAIPENPGEEGCSDEKWEALRLSVRDYVDTAKEGNNPWESMGIAKKLEIDGRVYQESYTNDWHSYKLAARSHGVTGYQFRAPGEWFSEVYAAYHSGKLKPKHPSAKLIKDL